jgi:hypothetical protein
MAAVAVRQAAARREEEVRETPLLTSVACARPDYCTVGGSIGFQAATRPLMLTWNGSIWTDDGRAHSLSTATARDGRGRLSG